MKFNAGSRQRLVLAIPILLWTVLACNTITAQPGPTFTPTIKVVPQTEAGVPRISPEDAKKAFDNEQAVIVDVRSADLFALEHVTGAINIPLADIYLTRS